MSICTTPETLLWVCLALTCGEATAQDTRMVQTQDGSRFVLVSTGGPPVVHWVTVIPTGVNEDPPGLEGLAVAITRASLAGTHALGSKDPLKENAAVARARKLSLELADAGGEDASLKALLDEANAEIRDLARPLAWEQALRSAPSRGSNLLTIPGAALLQVTTTTRGVLRVAELLKDRRDRALLRGAQQHFAQVLRERRSGLDEHPRTALRRSLVGKICHGQPLERFYSMGTPKKMTLEAARRSYRRINSPNRSRHVLTGGFDADTVEAILKQVYERAADPPTRVDLPALQASRRLDRPAAPNAGDTLAFGCPIPSGTSTQQLTVFLLWLAGEEDSYLVDALRARGHPRVKVRATAPFPAPGGFLLVEVTKAGEKLTASSKICIDLLAVLRKAMEEEPESEQLARARRRFRARRADALASPQDMALYLAQIWALTGQPPTAELKVDTRVSGATILRMCKQMFEKCQTVLPQGGP